jgi:formate hydrogenlyase transcriptional activator
MKSDNLLRNILHKLIEGNDLLSLSHTLYHDLKSNIPLNRLGIALISDDGHFFVSKLNISESALQLKEGYRSPTHKSSLIQVIRSNQPRIINDLRLYLQQKPGSVSTRLVVKEGMRSNMTIPLISNGKPAGVLFFSSKEINAYHSHHVDLVQQFSHILSITLEKALLRERLEQTQYNLNLVLAEKEGLAEELKLLGSENLFLDDNLPNLSWDEWQRKILSQTLARTNGRIYGSKGAAKLLDLPPTTLQSKMKKLGIIKHTDI